MIQYQAIHPSWKSSVKETVEAMSQAEKVNGGKKGNRQELTLIFINNNPLLLIVVSYSDSSLIIFLVMFPNKAQ